MARRNSSNRPQTNPLPNPNGPDEGLSEELSDLLEEALFDVTRRPQQTQASRTPRPQPQRSARRNPNPRTTATNLSMGRNNQNSCMDCSKDMLGMLYIINESTVKILDALKAEHLLDKKKADQLKKERETKDRKDKENMMESTGRRMSRTLSTIVAPIRNALDAILKFILFTIAGRVVTKILKWFVDPANKKKVESLTRFLKDWWPAILGAFVLFGTKFGAAIRSTVGIVIKTILHLKKIGIPGILSGLKQAGLKTLPIALLAGGGILAYKMFGDNKEETSDASKPPSSSPPTKGGISAPAAFNGGLVRGMNFLFPEQRHISEIGFAEGGHIDEETGLRITGAGPDTQLIAAQPGEVVMSKAAVDKYGADTFLKMNRMAGANNQPRFVNNIQLAQQGGMVGGMMQGIKNLGGNIMNSMPNFTKPAGAIKSAPPSGPKISAADYNSLLAIAAAEDSDPQGRADVAQSIYNRLHAGSAYGMNFLPSGGRNTIKDIITGKGQYEPTFKNRNDWLGITDRDSAARALANAKNLSLKAAMQMLNETEKALKNPALQMNAQTHVGGRPSFFGVSQQQHMKGDDVLRYDMINGKRVNRKDNFFTNYPAENSDYARKRGNIAAPIPVQMYATDGDLQSAMPSQLQLAARNPSLVPPGPRPREGTVTITELPPISMGGQGSQGIPQSSAQVPDFPVIPSYSDRYGPDGKLNRLGIVMA